MNYINPRAPTVAPSEALGTTEQSSARAMNDQESELGVPSPPTVGPMIARTASLNIVAKDFDKARAALDAIVRQHRGYAASLTVTSQPGSGRELKASLRVPADQLDAVIAETKKLGIVEQESQGGEEVTQQDVDLRTRLSNARVEEQRLVELLRDRTGKVGDVLAVEREIARVRGDIETMDADLKNLEHRVQFATLDVQLDEEYKAELQATSPSTGIRLRNSLVQGYRDAVDSVLGLVMFLLSTGPTLLFWALILFWPVRFVWRRLWRRFGKPGNAVAAPAAGQTGQPL